MEAGAHISLKGEGGLQGPFGIHVPLLKDKYVGSGFVLLLNLSFHHLLLLEPRKALVREKKAISV